LKGLRFRVYLRFKGSRAEDFFLTAGDTERDSEGGSAGHPTHADAIVVKSRGWNDSSQVTRTWLAILDRGRTQVPSRAKPLQVAKRLFIPEKETSRHDRHAHEGGCSHCHARGAWRSLWVAVDSFRAIRGVRCSKGGDPPALKNSPSVKISIFPSFPPPSILPSLQDERARRRDTKRHVGRSSGGERGEKRGGGGGCGGGDGARTTGHQEEGGSPKVEGRGSTCRADEGHGGAPGAAHGTTVRLAARGSRAHHCARLRRLVLLP
jgi:hypothetical protein